METPPKPPAKFRINLEPFYRFCARLLVKIFYNTHYEGFEKIPKDGPLILICNHIAYVDGLIINAALKRRVRYIIDKDIYNFPIVNYFMQHNRGIPIAATKRDVEAALDEISRGLRNGDIICIFPEGQMTYTGHLGRFRPGIEWIIGRDPVTIYPLALKGLWGSIFSRKYRKSKLRFIFRNIRPKVYCICGDPIPPEMVKVNYLQKVVMELLDSIKTSA